MQWLEGGAMPPPRPPANPQNGEQPKVRTLRAPLSASEGFRFRHASVLGHKKKETEQRPAEVGKRELFLWTSQQTGRTVGRFEDLRDGEVLLKVFLKVLLPSNF